jgi:hypothetical protein
MNIEQTQVKNTPPCAPSDQDTGLGGPLPLAMAYVPKQYWRRLYDHERALQEWTLFEELNFPFLGVKMGDHDE